MTNFITLSEAETLTHAWQDSSMSNDQPIAVLLRKEDIEAVIDQDNAVALRLYFSITSDGKLTIVAVGVDIDGHDMTDGYLLDRAAPCPDICDRDSPLAS